MDSAFVMDLGLAPVDNEDADPTWDADGITWSSSCNDEEESVGAIDESPLASDIGLGARTEVQVQLSDRPQPAVFHKATDEQNGQDARNIKPQEKVKSELLGPFQAESSDSDSSLASIPAIPRVKETPVPLPHTVTAASLLTTSVSSQPRRASLPPTAPVGPASTPTPVPLPLTAMRSASTFGQTPSSSAPVASLADLKKPVATLTREGSQPISQEKPQNMAGPPTSYPAAIDYATDGRLYTVYHQPSGQTVSTKGVLIPAGYKLHTDSRFPLVCPVQGCQRTFKNLNSLSGHFGASHNNMTFKDVGDGTLMQVGTYKNHWGTSPGIVVQQAAMSRIAPEPLEKSQSDARAGKRPLEEPDVYQDSKRHAILQTRGNTTKVIQFIRDTFAYMSTVHTASRTPDRPDIIRMLRLPKKRDLPKEFLDNHQNTDLSPQAYACATAYIIGDEVSGPSACHAATGPLARLSKECVVLPRSIQCESNTARMFSPHHRCVGCAYLALMTDKPDQCELRTEASEADGGDKRPRVRTSSVRPHVPAPRSWQLGPQREQPSYPNSSGPETEQTLAGRKPVRQSVLNRLQLDKDHGTWPPQRKSPSEQPSEQPQRGTPLVQQGQFGTPDYEMEDWEIAPGRVTSEDSSRNVAYSGAFLTSSTPITISPDICFNVLTVRPGQIYNVPAQKDKLQVFSVASGKVRVTMGGKVVQLGPNGAFPVRPSEECIIENRIYFEAVVHCTTVKDYELA